MQLVHRMKSSLFASFLFAAVAAIGCSKDKQPETLPASALAPPPPGPEFVEQEKVAAPQPPAPASESETEIAPDDQIHFALNSDNLGDAERRTLDEIATWAKTSPDRAIIVQGHADASGREEYNLELSARRAQAVGAYLQEKGVPKQQITVAAQGEEKAGLEPQAANRRVIIFAAPDDAG
jgi:OOP family OmpA-OmpF porin